MIRFPNCKINLGLRVTGKRADGYHDVETVFYPLPLRDALEVSHAEGPAPFELRVSGIDIPGRVEDNLCYRAWQLLSPRMKKNTPLRMHLLKGIPAGAGLGGGSSDGANALVLLNEFLRLGLDREELLSMALQLGSDCPFFIVNRPSLATGRGEQMTGITPDLSGYRFVLVDGGVHVSTAWAFGRINPRSGREPLSQLITEPVKSWKGRVENDFEQPVFEEYPRLLAIRDKLYAAGAVYASLTGTGSCVYGIFPAETKPLSGLFDSGVRVYELNPVH